MKKLLIFLCVFHFVFAFVSAQPSPCTFELFVNGEIWTVPNGTSTDNQCDPMPQMVFRFDVSQESLNSQNVKVVLERTGTADVFLNYLHFNNNSAVQSVTETTIASGTETTVELFLPPATTIPTVTTVELFFEFSGEGFQDLSSSEYGSEVFIGDASGAWDLCPELFHSGLVSTDLAIQGITIDIITTVIAGDDHVTTKFHTIIDGKHIFANNLKITEQLIVDADFLLRSTATPGGRPQAENANVFMLPGASIIVESGNTMCMWNYNVLHACPNQANWSDIRVQSGATLNISYCNLSGADGAITLDPGATLIVDNTIFENNEKGIWVIGTATISQITNNRFEDCNDGVFLVNADNINLKSDSGNGFENRFVNCNNGIRMSNASALIQRNIFDHCENGININGSSSTSTIFLNNIGYNSRGILGNSADMLIKKNLIGKSSNLGRGEVAIEANWSTTDIKGNQVYANEKGIFINFAIDEYNELEIFDNWVNVAAGNNNGDNAIHAFLTQGLNITNNRIQGSGQMASMQFYNGSNLTLKNNTLEASNYLNGIAMNGGVKNMIENNEILNNPINGIVNESSINNLYKDNDLNYVDIGLFVDSKSGIQTIQCNQFLTPGISLVIASDIGPQPFHQNWFQTGTAAVALGSIPQGIFTYDELEPRHKTEFDAFSLFSGLPDSNDGIGCDPNSGSGIPPTPPEVFCEILQTVNADEYWLKLRQLLGVYFDEHGPNQLPDCIVDCKMGELAEAEYELRTAMKKEETDELPNVLNNVKSTALAQIIYFEESPTQSEPCDEEEIYELYKETYISILKEASGQEIEETGFENLQSTAELCPDQYGEVVFWARGILDTYEEIDYEESDCDSGNEAGEYSNDTFSTNLNFTLSPNPVNESIRVTLYDNEREYQQLTIINGNGMEVLNQKILSDLDFKIATEEFHNGVYILCIHGKDGIVETKKFIVQH